MPKLNHMNNIKIFLSIIIILVSCKKVQEGIKVKNSIDTNQLDAYFSKQMPADEPGGAILIMKRDSIIFRNGYGIADLELQTKIDANTLFNVGSISKTFVSNAILMLQDEGKLSVEDNMEKYFPNFKNKAIAEKVKIKHLFNIL